MDKRITRNWTAEEEKIMLSRYNTDGPSILAKEFDRTKHSVQRKGYYMGLAVRDKGKMTNVELAQLRALHEKTRQRARDNAEISEENKIARQGKYRDRNKILRQERRLAGLCTRCRKPSLPASRNYCLLHWATLVGNSCGHYDEKFGRILLDKLEEQDYRCAISKEKLIPGFNTSIDHTIPRSKGGSHEIGNLQWVTISVNRAKSDMSLDEFISFCKNIACIFTES